jgi:chromosome segregation ATPase
MAAMLVGLFSCNQEEMDKLKAENDQLKAALGESNAFAEEMNTKFGQIDVLLDSIESAEGKLAITLTEGASRDNYNDRLSNVKDYIENTKKEIEKLERALSKSSANNKVFVAQIERLKKTLEDRDKRVAELEEQVQKYSQENSALIKTVDLQEQQMLAQTERINQAKRELAALEARIEEVKASAQQNQADSYFEQAKQFEALAQKTKLAPKKKKEHLQDAYNMYKKSFEAGRQDALAKMQELEKELK